MANLICFVPRVEMVKQAEDTAQQMFRPHNSSVQLLSVQAVETCQAAEKARQAVEQGADILIARGVQASLIKQAVSIPVVEISLTGQEMAFLIFQAKSILSARFPGRPRIAVIGFSNMFCDMSSFDSLYKISLSQYFVEDSSQISEAAVQAKSDGAQLLIGGDAVCQEALRLGLPHLFLASGKESIAEAFRVAEKVAYASDLEKRNTAQFRTLLDNTLNGVLRVDSEGLITHANHPAERLLGKSERELEYIPLSRLFPDLPPEQLDRTLQRGEEIFSTVLTIGPTTLAASMMPILVEGQPDGAILSFHEGRRLEEMETQLRRELYRRGQYGEVRFEKLVAVSPGYQKALMQVRDASALPVPLLLLGESGVGKKTLARCVQPGVPFAVVPCECIDPLEQCEAIFGSETIEGRCLSKGYAGAAEGGILYLEQVGELCPEAQYRLERLLTQGVILRGRNSRPFPARIRIIASEERVPVELVKQGILRSDLYYALCSLTVRVPPLRERREDILPLSYYFLEICQNRFSRFIRLTKGAEKWIEGQEWAGNLPELDACCRRLALTTPKRTVDEIFLKECMEDISGAEGGPAEGRERIVLKDPRADELEQVLKRCGGNRTLAAQMLNINPSTLWRRMKKWGITGEEFRVKTH